MAWEGGGNDERGTGAAFTDAAAFLRGTGSAPALATLDAVIGAVPLDSVLGFSLVTLRRDLADTWTIWCRNKPQR
jgi:hypothetical protein